MTHLPAIVLDGHLIALGTGDLLPGDVTSLEDSQTHPEVVVLLLAAVNSLPGDGLLHVALLLVTRSLLGAGLLHVAPLIVARPLVAGEPLLLNVPGLKR